MTDEWVFSAPQVSPDFPCLCLADSQEVLWGTRETFADGIFGVYLEVAHSFMHGLGIQLDMDNFGVIIKSGEDA